MVRAFAIDQFLLGVETLASVAVKAAVFAEINIAAVINFLQHALNIFLVVGVGRANEVIVGDTASIPR